MKIRCKLAQRDHPGNGLLTITHPLITLLTLDGGAIRNSEAVVVGGASGESGRLYSGR